MVMCVHVGPVQAALVGEWQLTQLPAANAAMPTAVWFGSVTAMYVA